jgi:hypothetical protein
VVDASVRTSRYVVFTLILIGQFEMFPTVLDVGYPMFYVFLLRGCSQFMEDNEFQKLKKSKPRNFQMQGRL